MVERIPRRTAHTGDTEFATATEVMPERAVDLSPSVTAANFYPPASLFGVTQGDFDFFFRVRCTSHP
jgi:hypothetical protein